MRKQKDDKCREFDRMRLFTVSVFAQGGVTITSKQTARNTNPFGWNLAFNVQQGLFN